MESTPDQLSQDNGQKAVNPFSVQIVAPAEDHKK